MIQQLKESPKSRWGRKPGWAKRHCSLVDNRLMLLWDDGSIDAARDDIQLALDCDWEVEDIPPVTMTFMEAFQQAKQGKKISRLEWPVGRFLTITRGFTMGFMVEHTKSPKYGERAVETGAFTPYASDIDATDWYVLNADEDVSSIEMENVSKEEWERRWCEAYAFMDTRCAECNNSDAFVRTHEQYGNLYRCNKCGRIGKVTYTDQQT